MEIQPPEIGELEWSRTAAEALDGGAVVRGGAAGVGVVVAVMAEDEVVGGAADGGQGNEGGV